MGPHEARRSVLTTGWDNVRSSYDSVARAYEERFLHELDGKPRDRELLASFASRVDDPVVELGCGPGQVGAFVRACGRVVVGLDLSAGMAERAAGRLDAAVVGDLRRLPLRSGSAGGVVAFYCLIHLRRGELAGALRECARVVRAGGRLLFSAHEGQGEVAVDDFLGSSGASLAATFFELPELVAATEAAGLTVTLAERRQPEANEGSTVRLYVEATASGLFES